MITNEITQKTRYKVIYKAGKRSYMLTSNRFETLEDAQWWIEKTQKSMEECFIVLQRFDETRNIWVFTSISGIDKIEALKEFQFGIEINNKQGEHKWEGQQN